MSQTIVKPPVSSRHEAAASATLKVSAYDRAASMVISLLVLVGAGVFCLLVGWLSSGIFHYQKAVPVVFEDLSGGGYENGVGTEGQHIEAPTESDIAAESDIVDETPDTLSAVVDAAASSDAGFDRFEMQFVRSEGQTGGRSEGTGKHRAKGTGGGFGGGARGKTPGKSAFHQETRSKRTPRSWTSSESNWEFLARPTTSSISIT